MGQYLACFKAYDVRGKVPSELNPEIAYAIGRAYADEIGPKRVCIGYDIRLSGPELYESLASGLNDAGVDVVHLGMVGTEMVYFATAFYGYDGGIMITASHNPPEYNGMKMVRAEARPISSDTGLNAIEKRASELTSIPQPSSPSGEELRRPPPYPLATGPSSARGGREYRDCYADFVAHLLSIVPPSDLKPLRVLADPGNGAAGVALDQLLPKLPLQVTQIRKEPDGHFPNGVPNPILEEARAMTVEAMRSSLPQPPPSVSGQTNFSDQVGRRETEGGGFDFGVAWDGDYDRCFFFDEHGTFIEGYYIVGLLAQALLQEDPNQTIIYDPRLMWNTLDIVERLGGRAVVCKSGHAFIKEKMRAEDAVYGGEMSAHHYFKSHWYCDSGMIPFLLVARLVSKSGRSLGEMVGEMVRNYPCSGEVNSTVSDVPSVLKRVEERYPGGEKHFLDGLTIEYPTWRFNLRGSNTEPVIRLNVETRGDAELMREKTHELLAVIRA